MLGSKLRGQSKINQDEVLQAQEKLRVIKYPVKSISNAIMLKKKINEINQSVRQNLSLKLDKRINAYRKVRGDGNCFFRAFAFSYISNKKIVDYQELFPLLNDVNLDVCKKESIPKQFRPFYKDELLKGVLKNYWNKEYNIFIKSATDRTRLVNYKRALATFLIQNPYIDFLMILYFRAVCLFAFGKMKQSFKQFLKGTEQEQVMTYGQQSEGVILDLMNRLFQINIFIYQIRKNEVVTYEYQKSKQSFIGNNNIYLLFYDGHYDLLQINNDPLSQYQDEKQEQEYYADSSQIYSEGICIECNRKTDVSSQTSLCISCYNKSMENLNTFQKDRLIQGVCIQCNRIKRRVSEQLQICQSCLQLIQYQPISKQANNQSNIKGRLRSNYRCSVCNAPKSRQQIDIYKNDTCYSCLTAKSSLRSEGKIKTNVSSIIEKQKEQVQNKESVIKAKIFQRQKPYKHQCHRCHRIFDSNQNYDVYQCEKCTLELKISLKPSKIQKSNIFTCQMCKRSVGQAGNLIDNKKVCEDCFNYKNKDVKKSELKSGVNKDNNKSDQVCVKCQKVSDFYVMRGGMCSKCAQDAPKRSTYRY